jgi:hypothetical protein
VTEPKVRVVAERDWPAFVDAPGFEDGAEAAQGLFLTDAMLHLNMAPAALADRIGVSRKSLGRWMLPIGNKEFRGMPCIAWKFILEIVERTPPQA